TSCDSGVQSQSKSCDSGVPIPSISCDSGVPIPSMDTSMYQSSPRHARRLSTNPSETFAAVIARTIGPAPPNHVIQVLAIPSISCDSGVPITSISCDSGVPIPSMDTGVYNQAPRHADGFYKHW
ncbi:unnamed protein product, partial [Staurois parvus]